MSRFGRRPVLLLLADTAPDVTCLAGMTFSLPGAAEAKASPEASK